MACLLLVACSKNNGHKDSDPALFREYITGFSAGTIPANGPIEVILTEALSEERLKDLDTSKLFEFSPAVEGKVIFEGSLLKFVPNESLEHNKEYAVTLHLDKLFDVKKDLKSFYFHVRTQSLLFEVDIRDLQSYSRDYYFLNAYLEASDNISPEMLPELVSATIDGQNLRIKPQATESATRIAFIVDSIPAPKDEQQTLRITWDGSSHNIESEGENSLTIPTNNQFGVVQLLQNEGEHNSFSITFSAPLDKKQDLRGLVTVPEYKGDLRYSISGNTLKLYADENFEKEITIKAFQGIRSQYGERMTYDYTGKIEFDPIKPEVRFVRNGTILPSSQNLKVNFQTINLKAVEVSVMKIYQNNILQFLQDNNLGGSYNLRRVGATIARKVVPIHGLGNGSLSKWSTHAIDLSKLISPEPGAIYRVKIDFKKEYALNCNDDKKPIKEENLPIDEESISDYDEDYYYDDYNWDERDDPCKSSYYYEKYVETNILATDLGVLVKRGQNNDYMVVVNNLL
ncbi:MAG: hypothetical protein ACFNLX_05015, partial [Capnocytophaga granulosa]